MQRKCGWGEDVKRNAIKVLQALKKLADTDEKLLRDKNVRAEWDTFATRLKVTGERQQKTARSSKTIKGTTLLDLVLLVEKYGDRIEPVKPKPKSNNSDKNLQDRQVEAVRNVIHCLKDLNILQDQRDPNKKNTPYWTFDLNLTPEENIENLIKLKWLEARTKRIKDFAEPSDDSFMPPDVEPLPVSKHDLLFDLLLQLNFTKESKLVEKVINKYKTASFLVHGNNFSGQKVLVQRLLRLKDDWPTNPPIDTNVSVNFFGMSISNLWTRLAKKLGLQDPDPNNILEAVCNNLSERDMIFIFNGVEMMGFGGFLSAWIQAFWEPLVEMTTTEQMSGRQTHLLMFLVANGGNVSDLQVRLADTLGHQEYPRLPLLLQLAGDDRKFKKDELEEWISRVKCHRELVRPGLTADKLLAHSNGTHEIVYKQIYLHYDIAW